MNERKPEFFKHEILAIDVWGNQKDGWEINDMKTTGTFVDLHDEMTDEEIIVAVRGALGHRKDARGYHIQSSGESVRYGGVCIDRNKNGKPAYYTRVAV